MVAEMKHLKLLSLVAILFAATTADSIAQLTKIWDRSNENFALERLCRPGKLAVVSLDGINQFLIDLTNGETIHSTKYPESIYINFWGDRYYIHNAEEKILREYDVKTKEFIKIALNFVNSSDSSAWGFNYNHNSLVFYNANSGELLDSFKIPGSPDEPIYSLTKGNHRSYDARYLAFHLQLKNNPQQNHFFLYDRQAREIIMRKDLPANSDLIMQFFNTSNLMAYSELVQLQGDDKKYSYIRIYDPDQRKVIRDIKLSEGVISWFLLKDDDKYFIYRETGSNTNRLYDYINNKKNDYIISNLIGGPLYYNDTLIVTGAFVGYHFDWNAVSVEDEPNPDVPIIYPNPTTNTVNIDIEHNLYHGQWHITDLTGSELIQGIILPEPQLQINIGHLPAQTYFLRLQKENFIVTYQIVKI